MITKASFNAFVFLNEYFWFVSKRSMQDPVPLKQVVVLIKLIKLYRSTNSLMHLLSRVNYNLLPIRNTMKVNNLR